MSPIHIIISGASSVGKSTLVDECVSHLTQYSFTRIQEVARTVLNRLNLTGKDLLNYIEENNLEEFTSVQEKIIEEQILYFNQEKEKNYLSDRAAFDALAYIHHYFNNKQKTTEIFQSKLFQLFIEQCQNGFIFIIQPQEELKAQYDNMRIVPNYQDQIGYTECLKYWYEQAHLPYFVINDLNLTKRLEFIQQHINGYFHWVSPEFPIPLCLPFHLDKPKQNEQLFIRFMEILDKQNIQISYKEYDSKHLNDTFVIIYFHSKLDNVFIEKVLSNRIFINGEEYHFIGDNTNNQLQGRSCYLCTDQIEKICDFNQINNNVIDTLCPISTTIFHPQTDDNKG
jgi:predicted ATPase